MADIERVLEVAAAVAPEVFKGIIGETTYALIVPWTTERRKIIEISDGPNGPQSRVVKDYETLYAISQDVKKVAIEAALAEKRRDVADDDDPPEQKVMLMQAWQNMVQYLAVCDDTDKADALKVVQMITAMISGDDNDLPLTPTGMGLVSSAATTYTCPKCGRAFSTEAGLINHLKTVHSQREKTPYPKSKGDKPVSDQD